jgi:hypothetical protein
MDAIDRQRVNYLVDFISTIVEEEDVVVKDFMLVSLQHRLKQLLRG